MLFNFLSPPKVGGEYRGGFLSLLTNKAAMIPNKAAIKQNIAAIGANKTSMTPTPPKPSPEGEGFDGKQGGNRLKLWFFAFGPSYLPPAPSFGRRGS